MTCPFPLASAQWVRLALCALCLLWPAPAPAAPPLQKVTIATGAPPLPLLELTTRQGYFAEEGLEVLLQKHVLGKEGLERMLAGECDFAILAAPPVVHYGFGRDDFRVIASIFHNSDINQIVARKDRGILTPGDLRGMRIAVARNTAPHFFADLLLSKHGIGSEEVTWIFAKGVELPDLLRRGGADAVATVNQQAFSLARKLGRERASLFHDPGICHNNIILVAKKETLASRPELADRLLRALLKTEKYLARNPDELPRLFVNDPEIDETEARLLASSYYFKISLPHVLLLGMEDIARWSLSNGLATATKPVNFLDLIDPAPLRRVAPEAVTLEKAGSR